jgi:hypothetical protein
VEANVLDNGEKREISKEAARWIGAQVAKMFEEGLFTGKVVDHIPDLDEDLEDDSEKWVIEYDKTGKKEAVDSEELLAILAGIGEGEIANENEDEQEEETKEEDMDNLQEEKTPDSPKPKTKQKQKQKQKQKPKKKPDPLIGRKVRSWMQVGDDEEDEAQVTGTITGVTKKKSGKKKGKYYEVEYDDGKLDVQLPNEKVHQGEIEDMLVSS